MSAGPDRTAVAPGTTVVLERRARVLDDGAVLLGGSPPRMLHLSSAAAARLVDGRLTVTDATSAALARHLLDAGIAHPVAEPADIMPRPSEVTVVIPVRDRTDGLARLLTALADSARPGPLPAGTSQDPQPLRAEAAGGAARPGGEGAGGASDVAGASGDGVATSGGGTRPSAGAAPAVGGGGVNAAGGGGMNAAGGSGIRTSAGASRASAAGGGVNAAAGAATGRGGAEAVAVGGCAGPASVIVVDDGSADLAAVRAVAARAGAMVLRHPTPRGPAAARNAGLAAATTPLVAFLDSDVVPEPGWLTPLLARLADPAVGLVAPRIVALPPVTGWLGRYEAVRSSLDLGPDPALIVPRSRVAYVPSAAMLVRRAAVGAGFDAGMHVAEDVDLILRLHTAGWRLRYEPASRVAHDHRTSLRAWWTRKAFYGTGAAPLALRHRGAVPPMVMSPWSAATSALLLLGRPGAAVAVSAVAACRLSGKLRRLRHPRATAARLIALGAVGAAAQTADAVTRHYWPLAALAALLSRRARRTFVVVAIGGGVLDWLRAGPERPALPAFLLARRLDDLAYGAGLWWGAAQHRTLAPLRPASPSDR